MSSQAIRVYLNTGTWSDDVRGGGPDRRDDQLFPYIRVDALDANGVVTAQASLRYWGMSGESGVRRPEVRRRTSRCCRHERRGRCP